MREWGEKVSRLSGVRRQREWGVRVSGVKMETQLLVFEFFDSYRDVLVAII